MRAQLSFALLVGIGTSFFHTPLLIEALGLTAVTVACLFIIATSISFDFTQAGVVAVSCCMQPFSDSIQIITADAMMGMQIMY